MLKSIKRLGLHSFFYGLGSVAGKLLGFILLPIYTRYLTPADYGILAILTITQGIVISVAQFGVGSALFREIIYNDSDETVTESTATIFLTVAGILFFGSGIILADPISTLIFNNNNYAFLLKLVFITGFLDLFKMVFTAQLRIREQSGLYAAIALGGFLAGAALNIYFVAVLRQGLLGLITAQLILAVIYNVIAIFFLSKVIRPVFSRTILRSLLTFGIPLIPANISVLILNSADRYILNRYTSADEVGIYSLGYNIGMAVNLVVMSVQLAWPAQMFEIAKKPDAKHQFASIFTYYCAVVGFVALGLSVLAREVLMVMATPAFFGAYLIVPMITLSYLLDGVRYMTTVGLFINNKTNISSVIIVITAGFNLLLSFILIPRFGMLGAAWSTLISYLLLVVINLIANLRVWTIPYEYARIGKLSLVWAVIFGFSLLVDTPSLWLNLALKSLLLLSYPLLLIVVKFYSNLELDWVKNQSHRLTSFHFSRGARPPTSE